MISDQSYYRRRNEYWGPKGSQVKRLKERETETLRLREAMSDLTLDKQMLHEAIKGIYGSLTLARTWYDGR